LTTRTARPRRPEALSLHPRVRLGRDRAGRPASAGPSIHISTLPLPWRCWGGLKRRGLPRRQDLHSTHVSPSAVFSAIYRAIIRLFSPNVSASTRACAWPGCPRGKCPLRVKRRNTRCEQMFSAVLPTADIRREPKAYRFTLTMPACVLVSAIGTPPRRSFHERAHRTGGPCHQATRYCWLAFPR
jgi:hypothetical protein